MRCRNCSTVLMDTDPQCLRCGAPAPSDEPAGGMSEAERSNLRFLSWFGFGILGMLVFDLCTSVGSGSRRSARRVAAAGAVQPRGGSPVRRLIGAVVLLVGCGLLAIGVSGAWDTWELANRKPLAVNAAELRQATGPHSLPEPWISYTFEKSKATGLAVVRKRLGTGGDVTAPVLLVQVGDRWLIASVGSGFRGNRLVGRLQELPAESSKELLRRIRAGQTPPPDLLPYEFNAIDASAGELQARYVAAGILGLLGLLGLVLGLRMVRGGRRLAPAALADPRRDPFAARPLVQS